MRVTSFESWGSTAGCYWNFVAVTAQTLPVTTALLFHLLTSWTWRTISSYLGPNPRSQTHPQDVRTNVSSCRNPDIWTSLDPDSRHPALLWILSPDSDQISGNLGIYDNCSCISSLPCSYPPSPLTSVHVPMPPDCIPNPNCPCITFPWLSDTSSDGFPFLPFLPFCIMLLSNSLWSFACSIAHSCPC
jgi:hypothetical protein